MRIIANPVEIQDWTAQQRCAGRILALVPTMGFFHDGHLALMRWAREHCDTLMVSLFVNPTQFAPSEDLGAYPRDLQRDAALAAAQGVDVLFTPDAKDMFPEGYATWVEVPALSRGLCAIQRPTHFRGVATVVSKLFLLTHPSLAVFGEKDWQQLAVIRKMAKDLGFPVQIIGRPIIREPDGLAMSSRNIYLDPEERAQAPGVHQGLLRARQRVEEGETDAAALLADLSGFYGQAMPRAEVDYLALVDPDRLFPLEEIQTPSLLAVAVRFGKARLIDNMLISLPDGV